MPKWFNTAGPCKADIHYMLSPTARLPELRPLIDQQNYFVIHAPRQVGKTTAMLALAQLDKYLDGLGLETGWLVIFDRRPGLSTMGERVETEEALSPAGRGLP